MSAIRMRYILLALAFVFLILFLHEIDPALCMEHMRKVGFGFIPILAVSFLAYLSATLAWMICYYNSFDFSFLKRLRQFFNIRQIGESLATINPTGVVGGDALKYVLMGQHKLEKEKSILSLSLLRILTILSFLFLVFVCIFMILARTEILVSKFYLFSGLAVLTLFCIGLTWLIFSRRMIVFRLLRRLFRMLRLSPDNKILGIVESINLTTSKVMQLRGSVVMSAFILLMIHWLFGALEFLVILHYLGLSISLLDSFVLEIGTSFTRSLLSFIPGQIGVEEYSNKLFLDLVGVKAEGIWIAVSIIRRIRQVFWISLGVFLYLRYYRKSDLTRKSENLLDNESLIHQS